MAKQTINIGTSVNAGNGDPLRTAFDKINDNFNELYAATTLDLDSIGSNMIPDTNGAYNLGSTTNQWGEAHIRDYIVIGGARLEADANGNLVVSGGSLQIKDVQGDIFADDSTKVFDSATQTFTGKFDGDLTGSVVSDDSTVIIDGVSGTVFKANIEDSANWDSAFSWGNHSTAGYIQDGGSFTGDVKGSVFADDSTLLVDAVNGEIPGYVKLSVLKTEVAASADFADFQSRIAGL